MKKLMAIVLCVACFMSFAISAAAATADTKETVVSLELDPTMETYTLTIPATVSIDPSEKSATLNVTLSDVNFIWSTDLGVRVTAKNIDVQNGCSYLVNTEDSSKKIRYTATNTEDGNVLFDQAEELVASVSRYEQGGEMVTNIQNGKIEFVVDGDYPGAGTYTDTLTFNVYM